LETQLNTQQQAALEELLYFIQGDEKCFLLEGYAGTGKTYLLNAFLSIYPKWQHLITSLKDKFHNKSIHITATTNKAVDVISQYYPEAKTLYSALRLIPNQEEDTVKAWRSSGYPISGLLIVDEASMLSSLALDIVEEIPNLKTIFIGDSTQLPPVNEEVSPVFTRGYPSYKLTELMRQPQGILQDNCESCRVAVTEGKLPKLFTDNVRVKHVSKALFDKLIKEDMNRPDWRYSDSKVITYTNTLAVKYNKSVKEHITGTSKIEAGTYMINNQYNRIGRNTIRTDERVYIQRVEERENYPEFYLVTINGFTYLVPKNYKNYDRDNNTMLDLRNEYACTVHKSQGSTFKRVYIDIDNLKIAMKRDFELFKKLLYVAVSRASEEIIFKGDL
jgi:DNA helicase